MLSYHNIVSQVKAVMEVLPLYKEYRSLSFLPLCHILTHCNLHLCRCGVGVYYAESMETIADNLKEVKPTSFFRSSSIGKVYDKIMGKGMDDGLEEALILLGGRFSSEL